MTFPPAEPRIPPIFMDLTYDRGRFVLVGETPTIQVSDDGTSWSAPEQIRFTNWIFLVLQLTGVTYCNGQFVAVEVYGDVLTSADGTSWDYYLVAASNDWVGNTMPTDAGCRNGRILLVGDRGTILTSTDGKKWESQPKGTTEFFSAIADGGGQTVVVGEKGLVLQSADARHWELSAPGPAVRLNAVAYHDGQFVVVGEGGTNLTMPGTARGRACSAVRPPLPEAVACGRARSDLGGPEW